MFIGYRGYFMHYELYIDVFFMENLIMDYFLLRLVNRLMKCSATHLRSLAAAAIGSGLACISIIFLRKYLLLNTILVSVAVTTFMVRFGCKIKDKKRFLQGVQSKMRFFRQKNFPQN